MPSERVGFDAQVIYWARTGEEGLTEHLGEAVRGWVKSVRGACFASRAAACAACRCPSVTALRRVLTQHRLRLLPGVAVQGCCLPGQGPGLDGVERAHRQVMNS